MIYVAAFIIIGSLFTTNDDSPLSECMGTVVESYVNYEEAVAFCNTVLEVE
tara:strand:- start:671 stop:823 length:153 start_codon:yes stop_codon:yes gene_type:complete